MATCCRLDLIKAASYKQNFVARRAIISRGTATRKCAHSRSLPLHACLSVRKMPSPAYWPDANGNSDVALLSDQTETDVILSETNRLLAPRLLLQLALRWCQFGVPCITSLVRRASVSVYHWHVLLTSNDDILPHSAL